MKICTVCKKEKPIEDFILNHEKDCRCKECYSAYFGKYRLRINTILSSAYTYHQKASNGVLSYTRDEFLKWAGTHSYLFSLYRVWLDEPDPLIKPSISRINPKLPFTLDNLQVTTRKSWYGTRQSIMRSVQQLSDDGKVISNYASISCAARAFGVTEAAIRLACIKPHRMSCGSKWRFKPVN